MRVLKYLLFVILLFFTISAILMNWPKGSIEKQIENNTVPAIGYGVITNGQLTEHRVVGELEKDVPAPINTIFNVASITKPVFCLVVLKLIDDGVLGLDDPIHPYWVDPEIKDDLRHKLLTPRILMSHQGGFSNWRWNNENGKLSFNHDPGTQFQYSGEGMEYLKKAVQNITRKNLKQLADSLIFQPLGMIDTRLTWDKQMDESRFAQWHNKKGDKYEVFKRNEALAADDMMTTVADLSKFAIYIMNGGGLSEELFDEMKKLQVKVNDRHGYGLGWQVAPEIRDDEYALVHGGADNGVRARLVILPKSKNGFIAFTNGDNGQKIIDRLMVDRLSYGGQLLDKIYFPLIWRIIHLPINF